MVLNINCSNPICSENNWTEIIEGVDSWQKTKDLKEVIIKDFVIKDLQANISGVGIKFDKEQKIVIKQLEFHDLSSKHGFPSQQIIIAIFRSSGLKEYLKKFFDQNKIFDDLLSPFKGFGK